jgi:hypothetical protein
MTAPLMKENTMNRRFLKALTLLSILMLPSSAFAKIRNGGLWQITIQTTRGDQTSAVTYEVCIPDDDQPHVPKGKKNGDCQATGALHGNALKYKNKCNRSRTDEDVDFTFRGDSFDGTIVTKTGQQEVRQIYSGRRIGDCLDSAIPPVE